MKKIYFFALLLIVNISFAHDFTELYLKFTITPDLDMNYVNEIATIYNIDGDTAYAVVDEPGFYAFKKLEHTFKVLPDPAFAQKAIVMATTVAEMSNWDRYPTHDVYTQMMRDFATNYPSICALDTIGFSVDGRAVLAVKISDNVNTDEDEPEFLYTGQMHGDEIVTYMMFLRYADYLLSNYGTDATVTNLVNNIEIYINPLSNPDGTYAGGDNTVSGAVRTNANNNDLNRNYPNPTHGDHPDGEVWQPETIMMMDYADGRDFVMSANSHSGIELVNYPWDTWTTAENAHPDNDWWFMVSTIYADAVHAIDQNYLTAQNNGVTQGKEWYPAYGSRQDYMNYFQNCREVTLELSNAKALSSDLLPEYWNYNKNAFTEYMEQTVFGVRGIVTDACTGNPMKAKVEIIAHDHDGSFVYSSLPVGNYHRPLLTGTYDFLFTAPNYDSLTVSNVSATNGVTNVLNVQLLSSVSSVDFSADNTSSCQGVINFSTNTASFTNYHWDFGDGNTSIEPNPTHIYPQEGYYTVKLVFEMCGDEDSLVKTNFININFNDAPIVSDTSTCDGAVSFTLNATPVNGGNITWFDDSFNQIATGEQYITPVLTATTHYYAQEAGSVLTGNVGKVDNTGGGGYFDGDRYLIFDAFQDFTLKSVKVYSDSYGVRNFVVKDGSGTLIHQSNIAVDAGEHIVNLNFDIPAGVDYQLKIESNNPDLFRNNDGVNFPYKISDVVSVKSSDVGFDYYYYFYDWEIEYASQCVSNMASVNAIIDEEPIASFSFETNMNHVGFTNTSINATAYTWNFGDGNTSSEINPTNTYDAAGTYYVSLQVENECGSETYIDTVIVTVLDDISDVYSNEISIFPNPARTFIKIESSNLIIESVYLLDISGKIVLVMSNVLENNTIVDVSNLYQGIYFVKIISSNGQQILKKFVKTDN